MKKISSFLFATSFAVLGLTSCSSDDSTPVPAPTPQPQNLLLGKWDMQTMDMKMEVDGNVIVDKKNIPTKASGIIIEYDFKADNKVDYYLYTPANAQDEATEKSGTGTYQVNGEALVLTLNQTQTYTIKLLSNTNLHLNLIKDENVNGINDKLDITQKFTKM